MSTADRDAKPAGQRDRLFRAEALAAQRLELMGEASLPIPVSHRIYTVIAFTVSVTVAILLIFGTYTTHRKVEGTILPGSGLITLGAPIQGTIKQIYVSVGEQVNKNAPLVKLDEHLYIPKVGDVQRRLLLSKQQQLAILQSKEHVVRSLAQQKLTLLRAEESEANLALQNLNLEIANQQKTVQAARQVLREYQSVQQQGLISDPVMLQQQLTVGQVTNTLDELNTRRAAALQHLRTQQQSAKMDALTAQTQIDAVRQQRRDLQQSILAQEGNNTTIIRASHAGLVTSCSLSLGQEVNAGQPLLSMMGENGSLVAQLLVPSTVVPYLHHGTRIRVRYSAFPYQEFGLFHGTVQKVSKSPLNPPEILALTQRHVPKSLYLATVALHRTLIQAADKEYPLRPGMTLTATVSLRTLRLYQWLFIPFQGLRRQVRFTP